MSTFDDADVQAELHSSRLPADLGSPPVPVDTGELALGSRLRRDRVFSALFGQAAQTRIGHFVLLEPIATGGMGELFAAYDEQLDRKVALKLVRTDRASERAEARLLREAQALARLSHPNVTTVFEAGLDEHRVFVAMEYVHGVTLASWLEQNGDMPEPQRVRRLLEHFRDAARGLEAVHRAGLAHRDFKPENVLVGEDGRVRVLDFGLARPTAETSEEREADEAKTPESHESSRLAKLDEALAELDLGDEHPQTLPTPPRLSGRVGTLTVAGTLVGTPRYMAPEQWRTRRGDARSDQFSFCVALFQALHRRWPFEGASSQELRAAVLAGELRVLPRKLEVSPRLQAAILRGLAIDPDARHADMSELIAALDELLAPRSLKKRVVALGALALLGTLAGLRAYEPPQPLEASSATLEVARELEAEQRRVQIGATIRELEREGRHDEAEVAFEAFATLPEHADTRALAQAWLDRATAMRETSDADLVLAALGEAVLASASEVTRRAALVEIAGVFDETHRYDSLGATLRELDTLAHEPGALLELELHEAVSRRDIAAAIAVLGAEHPLGPDVLPILRELDTVTLTDHIVGHPHPANTSIEPLPGVDLDDDGHEELLLVPARGPALLVSGHATLPALQVVELPPTVPGEGHALMPSARALDRVGGPAWVHLRSLDDGAVLELREHAGQLVTTHLPYGPHDAHWVLGDLFAAWPGWESFGASPLAQRLVARRDRGEAPAGEAFDPQPDLAALRSLPRAAAIADLDGDDDDELVLGTSGWWAYDVRVLEPRDEAGHFELAARRKLGAVSHLIAFPSPDARGHRIALAVVESAPSPRVFPPEQPAGVTPGVYVLGWAGRGHELESIAEIPLAAAHRLGAGDLDGNGRSELVVERDEGIAIVVTTRAGRHLPFLLEGLSFLAIQDLDRDGDDELIVREQGEGRVLVLGSGHERLPSTPPPQLAAQAVPDSLEPELTGLWQRAETLAGIGLAAPARTAFEALARVVDPRTARLAHRRAAELAEFAGMRRDAAAAFERAGDPDSLARAFSLYEATFAFEAATRVAAALGELDELDLATRSRWRDEAERSASRAEPRDRVDIDFRQPLDDRWQVARGELLQLEADGLRLDSLGASDSLVMRRELEWTGERLRVELDLDVERLEWGSGLVITLHQLDAEGHARSIAPLMRVIAYGGGDHYALDFENGATLEPGSHGQQRATRGALPPRGQNRFLLTFDLLAGVPTTWQQVTTLDGEGPRDTALAFHGSHNTLEPGRFEVRVSTGSAAWMRGKVMLRRMTLLGARDVEARSDAGPADIERSLARGEYELALAGIAAHADLLEPREAAWLRVLALEQLGRWTEAIPELERAMASCDDEQALRYFAYGMLLRPDRFAPTLRRVCARERFLAALWQVAEGALFQHKDLDDLHRTLTTHVVDVDRVEPRDERMLDAVIGLLTSRARGWSMQDLPAAAESDLGRVLALLDAWPQTPARRRAAAIAEIERAAVLLARDRPDDAARAIERALERDEAPEIIADLVLARPVFRALREHPVWVSVAAVQRGRPLRR